MKKNKLSALPQIETLLQDPAVLKYIHSTGRPVVARLARSIIQKIRDSIIHDEEEIPLQADIIRELLIACHKIETVRLQNIINATGVLIHTNMGRSPLSKEVWDQVKNINCGYSNLELDLHSGKRGSRKGLIPSLVYELVNAEDTLIVNNNAAAVFLILQTFAQNRNVIVSRGEQVQIGGGFRIPDILQQSGAHLVEVGTTNITTADDYRAAINEQTAMILSVHRSNFAIRGFNASPSTRELATVKQEGVLLCIDQGSGVLNEALPGEISVKKHLADGADLVCFSGDKIFGGPQSGIIVGKKELIQKLEHHPLMRVFRPGKTIYSLLESTLINRLNGKLPLLSETLQTSVQKFKERGIEILKDVDNSKAIITESTFTSGGGSMPDESFPSLSICIESNESPEQILRKLRESKPPIIGTITDNKVHLNLATITDDDIPVIQSQLKRIFNE